MKKVSLGGAWRMRVGVVGSSGILGRSLLPLLVESGFQVRALSRASSRAAASNGSALPGVEYIACDLLDSPASVFEAALKGCEVAVHIATAIPRDPFAPGAWNATARLRTEGTYRLIDAAQRAGVGFYVQQSIVMAYRDGGESWLDEDTPLDTSPARAPICAPVIAMEMMVRSITSMRWCILRGGSFVGPGTIQEQTLDRLSAGKEGIACDGSNYLSPVHVADMASAIAAAIRLQPENAVFNIVDEPLRQGDYLDALAARIGAPHPRRDPSRPCPPSFRCSSRRAQVRLGWRPTHGIWPVPVS